MRIKMLYADRYAFMSMGCMMRSFFPTRKTRGNVIELLVLPVMCDAGVCYIHVCEYVCNHTYTGHVYMYVNTYVIIHIRACETT